MLLVRSRRESPEWGMARLLKQLEQLMPQETQRLKDVLQGKDPAFQREWRKLRGRVGEQVCVQPAGYIHTQPYLLIPTVRQRETCLAFRTPSKRLGSTKYFYVVSPKG